MLVIVRTYDLKADTLASETEINFGHHEKRVWLQKHIAWALNNSHGVQIVNASDEKKAVA